MPANAPRRFTIKDLAAGAFRALPFPLRYRLFVAAARSLGVESYTVDGPGGPFAGPLWDQTIIKSYLRYGWLWGQDAELEILNGYFGGPHGTLYDIGANIGIVTIPLAQAGISVVAFEPDELNCALLRANISRNCPDGEVTVLQKAVYREPATLRFARSTYNSGDNHLDRDGSYEVECIALDSLPIPDGPFAVKIDTQGAEPGIFAGGARTLRAAGMVLTEFWPAGMERLGNSPEAVLDLVGSIPHAMLIPNKVGPWISGAQLADQLNRLLKDRQSREYVNGIDFLIARERFALPGAAG